MHAGESLAMVNSSFYPGIRCIAHSVPIGLYTAEWELCVPQRNKLWGNNFGKKKKKEYI